MPEHSPTAERLLQQAQAGDDCALACLFNQHRGRLRNLLAFRMDKHLHARLDPSDILQESFLTVARRIGEYDQETKVSFFVWVRAITMDRLLYAYRQHITTQKRDARRDLSLECQVGENATSMSIAVALLANGTSQLGQLIRKEQTAKLLERLSEMDAVDQEIIAMRVFEGLTNGEAAEALDITKRAASKRFVRAIRRLRIVISDIPGMKKVL
ncbi:RNA polymerase sigma factor [Roseimaritima multifibrata]|uniref:RNA polymerase sigma factor n=1 Tax=Roseimaritima multifibrata TaxID=1930274 RepID=A0A517MD46_9BACT|nr:sigma-70 family RNA polymerase sigma factor [Roseimaritima multifibrata]QDS92814.1 RNA polymerase sigma factor [Roseimaritima multifibrata]